MKPVQFGERLRTAIEDHWHPPNGGRPSQRNFHKVFTATHSGDPFGKTSKSVINSYVKGHTRPPLKFVEAAAGVLGVRKAWLAVGEGAPTIDAEWVRAARAVQDWKEANQSPEIEAAIRDHSAGEDSKAEERRRAVRRFLRKLDDAATWEVDWYSAERRAELAKLALTFLVDVDRFFGVKPGNTVARYADDDIKIREAEKRNEAAQRALLLLPDSSARGWWVHWYDSVLTLFSQRVMGLGVRSGGLEDSHFPVAASRGRTRMDADES